MTASNFRKYPRRRQENFDASGGDILRKSKGLAGHDGSTVQAGKPMTVKVEGTSSWQQGGVLSYSP